MIFFRIIVPNYNNITWLDRCIGSIKNQTFEGFRAIIVDDCSTDGSFERAKELCGDDDRFILIHAPKKSYNGGARNVGLEYATDTRYTLFLDSDDWFVDDDILQDLHDFIIDEGSPDCVRLPYNAEYDGDKKLTVNLNDSTIEGMAKSIFVACWTKCIKTSFIVKFPENTLMEDVVQHIKQCDNIDFVVPFIRPVVVHNGNNLNSCTREENQNLQHGKWQSSMFRYMADLLDLELKHDYCAKQRDWRADICLKNIKNDKYTQSVD